MTTLIDLLRGFSQPVNRHVDRGVYLFQQGDSADDIYAVQSGRVRLVRYTGEGERLTQFIAAAGGSKGTFLLY